MDFFVTPTEAITQKPMVFMSDNYNKRKTPGYNTQQQRLIITGHWFVYIYLKA